MKPVPVFMTEEQIVELKNEIAQKERMLAAADEKGAQSGVGFYEHAAKRITGIDQIKEEIAQKKRMIENGTPQKLSPTQANKAYKLAKQREEWIKANKPRQNYVRYPTGKDPVNRDFDFERAVKQEMDWQLKSPRIVAEYRYLMRRLDPSNPMAGNIERL